ncbi:protein-L-isoaspartate(D-aspartate) O-methyltransferase [Owenweeksia hongkongensis]|uniref:Protein-L-isoaspartate O-methyltransferase n=1 Tax=Owenweeksia hongkongensis (strain DSM 17368 / CIP 108786 / JCM 12287 / NRRL B-23963 / UST20020801) TaxID=926562 RepID=G8R390_OWEHD|nr:protein-L-isoaspartate(D-aspartate) O-methyltransferase [Owenweeksia hongkongensis]AEV31911.1 protein-L-isoaspartate and D-aspartate O-methyltransferase [Owenweeksia hongkongensis DSM 17368]
MLNDLPRHKGQRNKLVKLLITKGIRQPEVLKAIGKIPRHLFMDSSFEDFAYQDKAFPIAAGQTISQPYTVAFQSELLQVKPGMKVLEIGTGSGYQASVLHEMGCKVHSIERQKELFDITRQTMRKLGYYFDMKFGDGFAGLPSFAPFERIIVTCGAPKIPEKLLAQMSIGARMVIPVGEGSQVMKLVIRDADGSFSVEDFGDFRFVPMLGSKNV